MSGRMNRPMRVVGSLLLTSGFSMAACSASENGGGRDGPGPDDYSGDSGAGDLGLDDGDGLSGVDGGMGGSAPLPEEREDESSFKAPVATGRYLWSANPQSGRVALIDGKTLGVQVLSAGLFPTHLSSVPRSDDEPSAIVLNVGSSDASWFRLAAGGATEKRLATHVGANRWSVGTSGQWAVAFSAAEAGQALDPTEGLQEISVLRLRTKDPFVARLTVGYRPSRVLVANGDERVVVVSEDGLTLLTLGAEPSVSAWVELGAASGRDVSLTNDGEYALVRRADDERVEVITLDNVETRTFLTFEGSVTDLDLSDSGRAVAVIRKKHQIASFSFPDVLTSPLFDTAEFPDEIFGSAALTADGTLAVLYTNAVQNERVTIVNLTPGADYLDGRSLSTKSPVWSVTTSPDGGHAIVLGGTETAAAASFAVLSLTEARFPRVVGTGAGVRHVAMADEAALITATNATVHEAYVVRLPSLSVSKVPLSAAPLSAGALYELGLGFVAQAHPEGRVTFFDLQSAEARTLTGFELSAEVVDR